MKTTGEVGEATEKLALKFLKQQKLALKERNYRCRYGELDLIMQDGKTCVFIEVRYRFNQNFGGALESITAKKQQRLHKTAQHYLIDKNLTNTACRFDVISMSGSIESPSINWIKNAL